MLSFKRDFGDEEAYAAVIEHSYAVILTEKSTMEVALKDGLEKFPHSVVLNEWMEKTNELFKEVFEGAGNKKVHEPDCFNEVNMNDIGDDGEGNSSPVRGLIITEVNTEKEVNYTTPVDTTSLTMTQFHRFPGVNEEMIKLLDETELQVYRRKKRMPVISGDNLVGRNIGEAVDNAARYDDNDKREKLSRFFFDTTIVTEDILNELKSEDMKCRLFATLLRIYTKKFDVKQSFRDVALCTSLYYIVDHVKRTGTLERKYGMIPNLVKKLFCNYLTSQHHPMAKMLTFKARRVMNISWLVEKPGTECGIYLMRHMESYMGENEGRWECGLTGKMPADVSATTKLRTKYMVRLLTTEFNKFKTMIVKDFEAFRKLDILEQDMLLRESTENRNKKRKPKGRR
ncbi:unnamed protein product [Lactuca saligna]|uniref:Ubiquitin-like protease family profile domain-containing protein n=1 Tax=Lactuca saligna TaxID=75948 RepID=A0AA36E3K4_LACSI|nr:unnamed protein product [Lactuca saligna]